MKAKTFAKSVLVLFVIGTLVSAQQASAESVFTPKGIDAVSSRTVVVGMPVSVSGPSPSAGGIGFRSFPADTVETFDVEIEEETGPGIGKQLAVFAIITALVGYAVISLMASDDEPAPTSKPGGKEPPSFPTAARISVAIIR